MYIQQGFGLDINERQLVTSYADNEPYAQELQFCISDRDWCEFEKTQLYRDLMQYLDNLKPQGSNWPRRMALNE